MTITPGTDSQARTLRPRDQIMKQQTQNESKITECTIGPKVLNHPLLLSAALGMMVIVLVSSFFMSRPTLLKSLATLIMSGDDSLIVEEEITGVHPILSLQRNSNKSSKHAWDVFAHHRNQVMRLVHHATTALMDRSTTATEQEGEEEERRRHAIFFGPGNCNDLDIPQLLADFGTITLVDIDNATTQQGVERQLLRSMSPHDEEYNDSWRKRVVVSPSIDLSGAIAHTARWVEDFDKAPPRHLYNAAIQAVQTPIVMRDWLSSNDGIVAPPTAVLGQGGYDVAVSLCLLSQFASSFSLVLNSSKRMMDLVVLVVAIRNRHLSQLVQSLRPGGHGVMIIDMVSMDTLPELRLIGEDQQHDDGHSSCQEKQEAAAAAIEQLTQKAEQTGNYFHGTKRIAVMQALQDEFGHLVDNVQLGPPWKWTLAANKEYIVYSVVFRRNNNE
jgi:hypothetical protein